jgi:hypothetical protein
MRLISSIRQWGFPREFRIDRPAWPPGLPEKLEQLIEILSKPAESIPPRLIADVGTGLWRLRQKMLKPGTELPLEEMRSAYRHLESTWDALSQAGIQIRDHTGELVPEGGIFGLKVLAYQPKPGTTHEQVQETIRPSIYHKGQMIQMGEVIISKPEEDNSQAEIQSE